MLKYITMDKPGGLCRCSKSKSKCVACKPGQVLDLDAALLELDALNGATNKQENNQKTRRHNEPKICFEQSPPMWINNPTSISSNNVVPAFPLRVDTECVKDPPQQPPNSPVSPQLPYEQFRIREDPLPLRCEWDNRVGGRRISMKGRQRMLSGPDSSSSQHNDRYSERMRDRNSWRPYRIPRPKLLNMGHCSRIRTISAYLQEESDVRLPPIIDTSPVAATSEPRMRDMSDALRCMAIGEGFSKALDHSECNMNFPRSRSAENLERRVMDVAATTLDVVSEKIEKLHVN